MTEPKTKLEYALEHARRGWRVMPLHHIEQGICTCHKPACKTPAKHPRVIDPLVQATTDEDKIRRWWGMWEDANIAVVAGEGSGFVVLDVDPKNGGVETLQKLLAEYGQFPERVLAKTGGNGFHLFFAHPGFRIANTQSGPNQPSPIGQGLDFRGDGGYAVAVGSGHVSGKSYEWSSPPNGHLPAMPEWLIEKLKNRKSSVTPILDAEGQILDGNRHNTLRAWACQMRSKGMSKQAIRSALIAENSSRFSEPKPDDEVERIVTWVAQFQPGSVPYWKDADDSAPDQSENVPQLSGLISIRDVAAEMDSLYRLGAQRGLSVGWPSLNELYSVHRGDCTTIVAAPSAGKTTFGLNIVANMAVSHGWKIAICSTENKVHMMLADLAGMIAGATYYGNFQDKMTEPERKEVDQFIYDHIRCITAMPSEPFTIQYVLSLAKQMGADAVMVDPFGALALPQQRTSSNDSRIIRDMLHGMVQPFLKSEGMHMWLMVHTTKLPLDKDGDMQMPNPYNATDSAGFFNAADFMFGMRRPKSLGGSITEIEVQKVRDRFSGKVGKCQFEFEHKTGRYIDMSIRRQEMIDSAMYDSNEDHPF